MKILQYKIVATILGMLFGTYSLTVSANYTQKNVSKVQEIIEAVISAYGGEEKLNGMNTIVTDYKIKTVQAGQSLKPEPPWDTRTGSRLDIYDFEHQIMINQTSGNGGGGGNPFSATTIIDGDNSYNLDNKSKTKVKISAANFDTSSGPGIRINGTLLAKKLIDNRNSSRFLDTVLFNSSKHDLVSFTLPGGPAITLYIDQKNHTISKSERVLGAFLVEYYFNDYKMVDGILFPHDNYYSINGDTAQTYSVKSYLVNSPVDKYKIVPENYTEQEAAPPTPMTTVDMGDGVYWITQNNQNSLFVEFNDHIVMLGGLPGVAQRIEEVRKVLPKKPIKLAVLTHHHNDHIGGSQEIQDAGIKFVTVEEHQQVVRDSLAENDQKSSTFDLVKGKRVYEDSSQRLELIDIGPTPHTEHLILPYLPKQGIIFESDHFNAPAVGPMPPRSPRLARLVQAIQERKLNVKKITSAHSPIVTTMQQLMESYNKK